MARLGLTISNVYNSFFGVDFLEKGEKTGYYKDNPENRKLGRVGRKYTKDKEEETSLYDLEQILTKEMGDVYVPEPFFAVLKTLKNRTNITGKELKKTVKYFKKILANDNVKKDDDKMASFFESFQYVLSEREGEQQVFSGYLMDILDGKKDPLYERKKEIGILSEKDKRVHKKYLEFKEAYDKMGDYVKDGIRILFRDRISTEKQLDDAIAYVKDFNEKQQEKVKTNYGIPEKESESIKEQDKGFKKKKVETFKVFFTPKNQKDKGYIELKGRRFTFAGEDFFIPIRSKKAAFTAYHVRSGLGFNSFGNEKIKKPSDIMDVVRGMSGGYKNFIKVIKNKEGLDELITKYRNNKK